MSEQKFFNGIINFFLILTLSVVTSGYRKLEIHRCELTNGTIAFQETPCKKSTVKNNSTNKSRINESSSRYSKKSKQKHLSISDVPASLDYQQFINAGAHDKSVHKISDVVKSYNISMQPLLRWDMYKKVYNDKLLHIKFLDDQQGSEISLMVDFIFPDNKKFSEDELTDIIYLVGSRFVENSIEGRVAPRRMRISNGIGVMATFTLKKGSSKYKYTSKGAIFKGKWLIQFTMQSKSLNSFGHQYAINTLFNSLKISQ